MQDSDDQFDFVFVFVFGEESQVDEKSRELKEREESVTEKEKLLKERQDKLSSLETELSSLRVCLCLTSLLPWFFLYCRMYERASLDQTFGVLDC